jgi:hypothetical protein
MLITSLLDDFGDVGNNQALVQGLATIAQGGIWCYVSFFLSRKQNDTCREMRPTSEYAKAPMQGAAVPATFDSATEPGLAERRNSKKRPVCGPFYGK